MARTNVKPKAPVARTHEGAPSPKSTALKELRRTLMACMLWEDSFYESGESAADRIRGLVKQVTFMEAATAAIDARERFKLRHAPLLVVRELVRIHNGRQVGDLIARVIQRPDEATELLSLYWKEKPGAPLANQLKIGLARALKKFNEYELAKWDQPGAVRLRDVLFLTHARPRGADERYTRKERKGTKEFELNEHEKLFKRLADDELATPDTWETQLSGGADKKAVFERLMSEKKLGGLALLRNLRGMTEAGVSDDLIRKAITEMKTDRILPFRFIKAAQFAPRLEAELEIAMFKSLAEVPKLKGNTALLIDHSGSMSAAVSAKSDISRFDAAAALAMVLREKADKARVFTFSDKCIEVPPRRGFALLQAVKEVVNPVGTLLGKAVRHVYKEFPECDRIIVITDEQSADKPPAPQGRGYIVNVGGYKQGIAYGPWMSIDGWSEAVLDFIREFEADEE